MELPRSVRDQFVSYGRQGGEKRARRLSPERRRAIARWAAARRWIRERFGASSFEELGLPGGEIVDAGLADLAANRETPPALALLAASRRLRREHVPLPRVSWVDPEEALYRRLETQNQNLAHARYLAHLAQVASFCDALRSRRLAAKGKRDA